MKLATASILNASRLTFSRKVMVLTGVVGVRPWPTGTVFIGGGGGFGGVAPGLPGVAAVFPG